MTLVYMTGIGGDPGSGVNNPQIALMAALGPCGSLSASTFVNINEVTTVAAVYSLAPYMSSFSAIGSDPSHIIALTSSFADAGDFANTATGTAPGLNVPAPYTVPVAQVNTIANLLSACVNSAGGVSGDPSVCGSFFALTLPPAGTPSTNTIAALLNLAHYPTLNTSALFNLIPPASPFQPTQAIVPPDLSLRLLVTSAFTISPSTLTFAPAVIGFTQATQTVTIANGTAASVDITSTSIAGVNASDFAVMPQPGADCALTIPANTTCTFQLSFTPSAAGARAAYFNIGNTSHNPSIAIALAGSGALAAASSATLSPSALAFTQLGTPQTLTLTNSGSGPLSISAFQLSNPAYTETNNCGSSLSASASCSINVSVTAGTAAPATLTVADDASAGPQFTNLSYSPPGTIDFGHWAIGTTPSETLMVHGPGVFGALDFTITGPNADHFSFAPGSPVLSTSCSYEYRQSMPCYITLYYTPTASATSTAHVNITNLTGSGGFALVGTGDPAGLDFDLYQTGQNASPSTYYTAPITTLNIGSSVFSTPLAKSFLIEDTGTVTPLLLDAPVLSGPNAAEFSVTTPSCSSGCTPSVTFTPTANGTRSATLTYTDSSHTVTRTLALTGIGTTPAPVLTAATTLYFSNIPIGTVSAPQTITVNAYGNHAIQASLASTFSGGPQPFVFTGPTSCASTPCTLSIAYAPTSMADSGATVYIIATDTVGLSSGNIQAYGQVAPLPFITYNPASLTFVAQALNTISAPQTVTFTNSGTTAHTLIFSVAPYGGDYRLSNHCPASLAINAACTVDVRFAPVSTTGTLSSDLAIDGTNVTRYVTLSGISF